MPSPKGTSKTSPYGSADGVVGCVTLARAPFGCHRRTDVGNVFTPPKMTIAELVPFAVIKSRG